MVVGAELGPKGTEEGLLEVLLEVELKRPE
jgi:hypothetical protein